MEEIKSKNLKVVNKRRKLLPWWAKIIIWIFLIFGLFAAVGLILGIAGAEFNLSLYGLNASSPLSFNGLMIIGIFILNGITGYGLWTEKDWAILLGQIVSLAGTIICIITMLVYPLIDNEVGFELKLRLELLLLVPLFIKLIRIRKLWSDMANIKS